MDSLMAKQCYLNYAAFQAAQKDFVPASLRDVKLQASDVVWADIGGLKETKRILRETLEWPTKYAQIFAQSPLRLRSGFVSFHVRRLQIIN
jgi:peroxin-1